MRKAHFIPDCFEGSLIDLFAMKEKKAIKLCSDLSILPFLKRNPERESSSKRKKRKAIQEVAINGINTEGFLILFTISMNKYVLIYYE